jgi:hypothetical protein
VRNKLRLETWVDYEAALRASSWRHPLIDPRIEMPLELRQQIEQTFYRDKNGFYRWQWQTRNPKACEECNHPLGRYDATWVSHILSRGAHPNMTLDSRNANLLCAWHHAQWENRLKEPNTHMQIYSRNQIIIAQLYADHQGPGT